MHFGSTSKEELPDEGMVIAKKVARKAATIAGMSAELQVQKQQIKRLHEQLEQLNNYCRTLQEQFNVFQRQRAIELAAKLGGGPTE